MNGIGISIDPYHGGVPEEDVLAAAMAVSGAGLERHSYLMACIEPGSEDEGIAAAERVSASTGIPVARVTVRRLGRAASLPPALARPAPSTRAWSGWTPMAT